MDKKTVGIIATIASVLLCGFPGCCMVIFGIVTAAGIMPYETTFNDVSRSGTVPAVYGFGMLCLALVLIVIPIAVGFFTLRNKPEPEAAAVYDEPLPPAS